MTELAILASGWLAPDERPAPVPGFIKSTFAPLVRTVVGRCLDELTDGPGVPADRVGVVLGSRFADNTTLEAAGGQIAGGMTMDPLYFHQTVPTSVLGHIARERGITGPVCSVSARDDLGAEALAVADLLLADGAVDRVVTVLAELAPTERTERVAAAAGLCLPTGETAACLLVAPPGTAPAAARLRVTAGAPEAGGVHGDLSEFVRVCRDSRGAAAVTYHAASGYS